ncbi:MAG TPA: Rpn family recombination-promoting nuclease/putative transposase [Thermotogota bacterium]|nr:Rpn family recombination-promoting nuclease/putative transposase [Thermotogota bacterium]HOS25750.1 Rpn family recombination-promoting nuclease/putative transposase [Thermotogota bacterium]HPL39833.1 Rpn family recombination-promoting nuclease/putative transposase [Thermotogota bacterium]HQK82061.1 Rpn family recombination-promoting nuclease/putative transposase [Thermotogota bacterium]HRU38097.1 Rpn family recombination-promoting nuclease/putative transposase [Thermotogota bacterium]
MVNKPHDKLFKEVMGDMETVKSFIQHYLPPKIVRLIDPESITIETDSYIEKDLSEYFFDLLFRVKMQQEEAYVYLLFEHKSKVDKHVSLQLLGYMTSIWKKTVPRPLPVILPVVFYQGREKWEAPQWFSNRFSNSDSMDGDLKDYIPDYKYELFEISSLREEEVKGAKRLRIYLDVIRMRALEGKEAIREVMLRVTVTISELPQTEANERFFQVCIIYLFDTMEREYFQQLSELMKTVSEERSEKMQTIADMLRQEGIKKGREEGREELLWKQIAKKFPKASQKYFERLKSLTIEQLDSLGLELIDMKNEEELKKHLM